MIFLLILGMAQPTAPATPDFFWEWQLADLHQNIKASRWYEAKQNLAHLKLHRPELYREKEFVLTQAWIAERESSWEQVLRNYDEWGKASNWAYEPRLRALVAMGQTKDAIDFYLANRKKFPSGKRWSASSLYARALMEDEQYDNALKAFAKLSNHKAPRSMRMEAIYYSAAIHYLRGNLRAGRSLVAKLHQNWPGSDEALDGIALQERSETPQYLDQFKVWDRFARVAYSNRDFERAEKYFRWIAAKGPNVYERDRARYFIAIIPLKLGEPAAGLKAFSEFLDQVEGYRYKGLGSFQHARALLMMGKDREAIAFCQSIWDEMKTPSNWAQDCTRILILALRRSKDVEAFQRLEHDLDRKSAGSGLRRFYHRNAVVWALQRGLPHDANHHLQRLKRLRLKSRERQEALIWQGLVDWELGREDQAINLWLKVVKKDPNHYFGLIAGQLIKVYGDLENRWQDLADHNGFLQDIDDPERLHSLYHLAPDEERKAEVASRLSTFFPKLLPGLDYRVLSKKSQARAYAEIGRFDWANRALKPGEIDSRTIQFLKAKWNLLEGEYQRAIIWGESIARAYPDWTPFELLPIEIQQFIYPEGFANIVHQKASDFEVDPYLLLAIIREESKFNSQAKSVASARGLMQFIPSTASTIAGEIDEIQDFSLAKLYEPETSITLGARYVDKLMHTFQGGSLQAVAAYNAGELTVARWSSYSDKFHPLHFVWDVAYGETKYYCQKVLRAYYHYARVYDETSNQAILQPDHFDSPARNWRRETESWGASPVTSAE